MSRALDLRRPGGVSAEVVAAIEAAARRLGYRPNRAASALRTGRTHAVGVLVPDITNPVFPPILQGIEAHAAARGTVLLVANVASHSMALPTLERMLAQQVDGVVLATALREDPVVDFIVRSGLHAVMVNRADESGRLPSVISDDRLAMKLIVEHLLLAGCKRIAHLAGPQNLPTGVGRRVGFEQALRDHGQAAAAIIGCDAYSRDAGRAAMVHLLASRHEQPDAVACCNDLVALGAYDALAAAGLRIPADVSVTGHNDMQLVDLIKSAADDDPAAAPRARLARCAVAVRAARWAASSPATVVLRPELVVRHSTRLPR